MQAAMDRMLGNKLSTKHGGNWWAAGSGKKGRGRGRRGSDVTIELGADGKY